MWGFLHVARDYYGLLGYSDPEIVELWLGHPDPEIVQRKVDEYRRRVSDGSTIDEETRLAVRLAAEHGPVAVVSGSARDEIEPVLDAAGLLDVVSVVVPREDVANGKPAPDGYLRALELLGVGSGAAHRLGEGGRSALRRAHALLHERPASRRRPLRGRC